MAKQIIELIKKYQMEIGYRGTMKGIKYPKKFKMTADETKFLQENRQEFIDTIEKLEEVKKQEKIDTEYEKWINKSAMYSNYCGFFLPQKLEHLNYNRLKRETFKYLDENGKMKCEAYETPSPIISNKELLKIMEMLNAKIEAENAKIEAEKQAKLNAKFAEAKRTGKPVLIKTTNACNPYNFDNGCGHTEQTFAMPDGTTKTTRAKIIWD